MAQEKYAKAMRVVEKLKDSSQFRNKIGTHSSTGSISISPNEKGGIHSYEISKVKREGYHVEYLSESSGKLVLQPDE